MTKTEWLREKKKDSQNKKMCLERDREIEIEWEKKKDTTIEIGAHKEFEREME